jgi:hypothetical protein
VLCNHALHFFTAVEPQPELIRIKFFSQDIGTGARLHLVKWLHFESKNPLKYIDREALGLS